MPNASIVSNQIRWQRSAGGKQTRSTLVVAMRVNGRNVFDLLETVHLLFGELDRYQQRGWLVLDFCNRENCANTYHISFAGLQHNRSRCIDAALQILSGAHIVEHQHAESGAHG